MPEKQGFVLNLPGNLLRLPLHAGALKAWYEFDLPKPDTIICTSAGAFAISALAGWNDRTFDKGVEVIGNLAPEKIFSFQRGLKIKLAVLGITSVGLGLMMLFDDKLSKGKKLTLGLLGLAALLGTEGIVGRELLYSESLFSIDPLIKLLKKELDFNSIFNSPIHIEVLVTDMCSPNEVIFSNRDPRNSDHTDPSHRERWLKILRATSRLPGKFPFVEVDGIETVDGEVWTDFPIRQMKLYRQVVRLDYWSPLQPVPAPKNWIPDLSRSFDIMRERCTQKKFDNYEYERRADPNLPAIFCLRMSPTLRAMMPNVQIHNFTPKDMKTLINIGYQSVKDQLAELRNHFSI